MGIQQQRKNPNPKFQRTRFAMLVTEQLVLWVFNTVLCESLFQQSLDAVSTAFKKSAPRATAGILHL